MRTTAIARKWLSRELLPGPYSKSVDGLELQIATNHFGAALFLRDLHKHSSFAGPFLLTELLMPVLKQNAPSRVLFLASAGKPRCQLVVLIRAWSTQRS